MIFKKFSFNTGYCFVHLETPCDNAPSILFIQLYHATVKLNIGLAFVYFLNVNTLDHLMSNKLNDHFHISQDIQFI